MARLFSDRDEIDQYLLKQDAFLRNFQVTPLAFCPCSDEMRCLIVHLRCRKTERVCLFKEYYSHQFTIDQAFAQFMTDNEYTLTQHTDMLQTLPSLHDYNVISTMVRFLTVSEQEAMLWEGSFSLNFDSLNIGVFKEIGDCISRSYHYSFRLVDNQTGQTRMINQVVYLSHFYNCCLQNDLNFCDETLIEFVLQSEDFVEKVRAAHADNVDQLNLPNHMLPKHLQLNSNINKKRRT